MGVKDSKQYYFSWEEATKRVSESELKRIKSAIKRSGGGSGFLTKTAFLRDVLGDYIPSNIAELMYIAFGGNNKGIYYKDLISSLLVITRGSSEEKAKFVFNAFSAEGGNTVSRSHVERIIRVCDGGVSESILNNLIQSERVFFEQFYHWISCNPKATILSSWLLFDNSKLLLTDTSATPTFYQSVASITHFSEKDVMELEKKYWLLKGSSRSGRFDLETFNRIVCSILPESMCKGFFAAFDQNGDGHIDFKEMACGLSSLCRGPHSERRKFCFRIFDLDEDELLSKIELTNMAISLLEIHENSVSETVRVKAELMANEILQRYDSDEDNSITLEEFHLWMITSTYTRELHDILQEIGHILLGVVPLTRDKERQVVMSWIDRANRTGLKLNDVWFLVSMSWWRSWLEYVGANRQISFSTSTPGNRTSLSSHNRNGSPTVNRSISKSYSTTSFTTSQRSPSLNDFPPSPGQVDNTSLIETPNRKIPTLTNEGGRLKKNLNLVLRRDYDILPEPVYRALFQWYGGNLSLPRHVISIKEGKLELELYPIFVKLLRHISPNRNNHSSSLWSTVAGLSGISFGGFGGFGVASVSGNESIPRKYVAYTACFSRKNTLKQILEFLASRLRFKGEDVRLWNCSNEESPVLLEDEQATMEELQIEDNQPLLIEIRNIDMTWPEEMYQLAKQGKEKDMRIVAKTEKGITGLSNMGNTCFMNSALQCVSNTQPLTRYFLKQSHLYEINRTNPLGMKGFIAKRYGELVQELWGGNTRSLVPLKMRLTICKYAPRFNGFQQQDSQELLSFLLDGLHEDLNRVHNKPYVELKDSDGRSDEEVAQEAWDNHIKRNRSIVVDLFHGQLKSAVVCKTCGHASVTFDPFTFLSLPLPMDNSIFIEVTVVRLDGSSHVKYGVCLNSESRFYDVKIALTHYTGLSPSQMLFVELFNAVVKKFVLDTEKIRSGFLGILYVYEIPAVVDTPSLLTSTEEAISTSVSPDAVTDSEDGPICDDISDSGDAPKIRKSTLTDATDDPLRQNNDTGDNHRDYTVNLNKESTLNNHSDGLSMDDDSTSTAIKFPYGNFVVAMHRKMIRMDVYYLAWQSQFPSLFGVPVVISCFPHTSNSDLYAFVWTQVQRLITPAEQTSGSCRSLDRLPIYPFELKIVQKDGCVCAQCSWQKFCRGCKLECNDKKFNFKSAFLAIDWDPTALHLRYQSSLEKPIYHESVELSRQQLSQPIDLDKCLKAFTSEEELGEDESWFCSKCKQHRVATKKLDIWKLPPILIVHMKRFQFVAGRWIKSQKNVKFPLVNMDPYKYVVGCDDNYQVTFGSPDVTSYFEKHALNANNKRCPPEVPDNNDSNDSEKLTENDDRIDEGVNMQQCDLDATQEVDNNNSQQSENKDEVMEVSNGFHNGDVDDDEDRSDNSVEENSDKSEDQVEDAAAAAADSNRPLFNLYAISSHSGILGGGHYVSFAKNPNGKWHIFNDSSCKEITPERVAEESPYLLFYERQDLVYEKVIPDFLGRERIVIADEEDDVDAEVKKICVIQ